MRRGVKRRGNIMATILTFQPRLEKLGTKQTTQRALKLADVIIFSGVRYERLPEASATLRKPGKKGLKTA